MMLGVRDTTGAVIVAVERMGYIAERVTPDVPRAVEEIAENNSRTLWEGDTVMVPVSSDGRRPEGGLRMVYTAIIRSSAPRAFSMTSSGRVTS